MESGQVAERALTLTLRRRALLTGIGITVGLGMMALMASQTNDASEPPAENCSDGLSAAATTLPTDEATEPTIYAEACRVEIETTQLPPSTYFPTDDGLAETETSG